MSRFIKPYEQLEIYKLSKELINLVYKLTEKFTSSERYNLVDQAKRASVSVCLNIVEGNSRHFPKEQASF